MADRCPQTLGASLTARAAAGEAPLEVLIEEHTAVDALGGERRTVCAYVMLDVVPGITASFRGHAPPGRSCSELELEAVALDWTADSSWRSVLAVARALARIGEEAGEH